jgi:hypothetical protein
MMRIHRACWIALPLLVACGGGDMTALEGIYTIDTWTENTAGCAAEGDSILESQGRTALYVKIETFVTEKFINVNPCTDIADCESMASDGDTIHLGQWGFESGNDDDGWTNIWYAAFDNFDDETQCDGTRHEDVMRAPADGALRIEARASQTVQFAKPQGITDCWDLEDEEIEELVGEPACGELEVLAATYDSDLP